MVKLNASGHGGEVYKGLLHKSKQVFYLILWMSGFCHRNLQQRIKVCYIGIKVGFIFKRRMANLETNFFRNPIDGDSITN